ncbi:MAG: DUF1460 domain-containing protein [Bacteroidales bacterium]|nr:DUF1460 domain-containing protein [Bacteroidales bacterium]
MSVVSCRNNCLGALLALSLLLPRVALSQEYLSTADDIALGELVLHDLAVSPQEDAGSQMILAAKHLLGQPYVAGTQEGPEERLRIYLTRTDCILFAESCLGLVKTVRRYGEQATFEDLAEYLRQTRYRDGIVDGYASRLHYTTEWIRQGERIAAFEDVTQALGGVPDTRRIDFMSMHPDSYAPLKGESQYARDNRRAIARMEDQVNGLPRYYLPKEKLSAVEDRIQSGDILCFATSIAGLDYSHVVIAYRENPSDRLGFIHASTSAKKVVIEPRTLEAYLKANGRILGISVLRVLK